MDNSQYISKKIHDGKILVYDHPDLLGKNGHGIWKKEY